MEQRRQIPPPHRLRSVAEYAPNGCRGVRDDAGAIDDDHRLGQSFDEKQLAVLGIHFGVEGDEGYFWPESRDNLLTHKGF